MNIDNVYTGIVDGLSLVSFYAKWSILFVCLPDMYPMYNTMLAHNYIHQEWTTIVVRASA